MAISIQWECHNKVSQAGWVKQQKYVSHGSGDKKLKMKWWCWTSEASFLDMKTATSSPSYDLFFRHETLVSLCIQIYFFYNETTQIGLEPTLRASFEFKHFFKDLTSKYNFILKYRGLRLQYINLEGKECNLDHTNGHVITFIVSPKNLTQFEDSILCSLCLLQCY